MRVALLCGGRLARGAEAQLALDYSARATAVGRRLGLGPVEIFEIDARGKGKLAEGALLLASADGARLVVCDRQGEMIGSSELAGLLARTRDDGVRRLAFVVGGPEGVDEPVRSAAAMRLSFGPQTWPHALARVMLAEQIYRATTILAGGPYHRE